MRCVFLLLALAVSSACAASIDLGERTESTPYDSAAGPIKTVLQSARGRCSWMRAEQLMSEAQSFGHPRRPSAEITAPDQTESAHFGDCKATALWLCAQMNDRDVRFVVGKYQRRSAENHAWLLWNHHGGWWIFDPTNASAPIAASQINPDAYVPYYSWSRDGAFRHHATRMLTTASGVLPEP